MNRYSTHHQPVSRNAQLQYEHALSPQSQLSGSSDVVQASRNDSIGLALVQPEHSSSEYQLVDQPILPSNLSTYHNWSHQRQGHDDFLTEEEIRRSSHEILENDEMQQLLRHLSMVGTSNNIADDVYGYPSYMPAPSPAFNFDVNQNRTSGKAVVGWLKVKAAMRWGIFIRKKAAEKRRAQLVELED